MTGQTAARDGSAGTVDDRAVWEDLDRELRERRRRLEEKAARRFRRVMVEKNGVMTPGAARQIGEPRGLADFLTTIRKGFRGHRDNALFEAVIKSAWDEGLSSVTRVVDFRQGWLTVGVSNQARLLEASQFRSVELTDRLRAALRNKEPKLVFRGVRFRSSPK